MSAGAAMGLVKTLISDQVDIRIGDNFGAVGAIYDKFLTGEACDLLVLTRKQLTEMEAAGVLIEGSVRDLGYVKTGLAVSAANAHAPVVRDAASLKAALVAASSIYAPDTKKSTAGQHVADVLVRLGIWNDVRSKISEHPNGATAMKTMGAANDAAAIGCTQTTEILYTPTVRMIGLLPEGFGLSTVYSIAIPKRSTNPAAAQAAIDKLCGSAASAARVAAGFDAA